MQSRLLTCLTLFLGLTLVSNPAIAQTSGSYALLIAVTKYEHPQLNNPALVYPEIDAKSVGELLSKCGYEVEYLLGETATRENIHNALMNLKDKGKADSGLFIGLWGHGVRYQEEDFFCPYDSQVRNAKDEDGNELLSVEPDPKSTVEIKRLFKAIATSKSENRVVIADCCRNTPNTARGRGFGAELNQINIPPDTTVIFACKEGEQAYEHEKWAHGAFTKALLDSLAAPTSKKQEYASALVGPLKEQVNQMVSAVNSKKQTVHQLSNGSPSIFLRGAPRPGSATIANRDPSIRPNMSGSIKTKGTTPVPIGQPINLKSIGIELRPIPTGTFTMGSQDTSQSLAAAGIQGQIDPRHEAPERQVTLSQSFYLGITEVTRGQFRQFVLETGYRTEAESDGRGGGGFRTDGKKCNWQYTGFPMADDHPVVNVSWNDAMKFCEWLGDKEKMKVRLPSEAEWEYACRAGRPTRYATGDLPDSLRYYANVGDQSFSVYFNASANVFFTFKDTFDMTCPVASFKPNAFGLYDMHGNVEEWCADWYGPFSVSDLNDPLGPNSGTERVAKGPGFDASPAVARCSSRGHSTPSYRNCNRGFRIALTK